MRKILYLTILSFGLLVAKEPIEGHVKDAVLTFRKEGDTFYIQNKDAFSFKDKLELQECISINEKDSLQITCLTKQGQTVFFTLNNVLFQKDSGALIISPFFRAIIVEPYEILKIK